MCESYRMQLKTLANSPFAFNLFIEDPSSSMAEGPLLATYIEKLEGQVEDTFSQRTWELFLVDNMFQSLFKIMILKHLSTI